MHHADNFDTGVDAGSHDTALKRAEPGRPGRGRVRSLAPRGLAGLLAAFVALPLQAQAQTDAINTFTAPANATLEKERVGHRPGTTGAAADGRAGVGGLHTSEDVGERVGPRTRPSKGGPCWCELSKGPMTGALTSGLMSPDIRKVVDPWPRFVALLARYPLPVPRIRVRIWGASP